MPFYNITCPSCNMNLSIGDYRTSMFCTNCGKKLTLKWEVTAEVDQTTGMSTGSTGTAAPQYQVHFTPATGHGTVTVEFVFPTESVMMKGSFSYFNVHIDEKSGPIVQKGRSAVMEADAGHHVISLRQVNSGLFAHDSYRKEYQVDISRNMQYKVLVIDNELVLQEEGRSF